MKCSWCDHPITRKQRHYRIRTRTGRVFIHNGCLTEYTESKRKGEPQCSNLPDEVRQSLDSLSSDPLGLVRRLVL